MNNSLIIADIGTSMIKAKRGSDGREVVFPHALAQLTEADYQHMLKRTRDQGAPEYIRVNGVPYAFGATAERYTLIARSRATKYTPDYYGVFVAICLAELFDKSAYDISLYGSHPPGDIDYRDNLMQAGACEWHIETGNKERVFDVTFANTFDEPAGGLMNLILAADGRHYQHAEINAGRALSVDIGGGTTDLLAINPGGLVDYSLHGSFKLGLNDILLNFSSSLRANNSEALRNLAELPADRLREALRTGVYKNKGRDILCENEARESTSLFLNRFASVYNTQARGGADFDTIVLTGGGSGALYDRLLPILDHGCVLPADQIDQIHLANVRGGLKHWRLLEADNLLY